MFSINFFLSMGFLALVNAYTMRITLSVAITEMVVKVNNSGHEDLNTCPVLDEQNGANVSIRQIFFTPFRSKQRN